MKNFKNQKGITLVALVVTIIVLLILAGVTLSLVAGENGILKRATNAVDKNEIASAKEETGLLISDLVTGYYEATYVDKNYTGTILDYVKANMPADGLTDTEKYKVEIGEVTTSGEGENQIKTANIKTYKMVNGTAEATATIEGTISVGGSITWN